MNTRTPPVPDSSPLEASGSLPTTPRGPAGLDDDLRRFGTLTPLEQLERLEEDARRLNDRERQMRAAECQVQHQRSQP